MRPGGMSPGTYTVAIFLNGVKVSTEESVEFISDNKQEGVTFPFFNQFILASWGVDVDKYNIEKEPIDKNIPGSTASFSAKDNAIYIKIPQASMLTITFQGHHKVTMGIKQEILRVALRAK